MEYGVMEQDADARAAVLRRFLGADGRLHTVPAKQQVRLIVLDHIAQRFEPGRHYPELEVNALLRPIHDDVAALRRYLVEEGFLDRDGGLYWRSGGTFEV